MPLPNFLIIGAAKSGTSSLYMYLKQHPDIFMSPVKEPHYFSFDSKSKLTQGPGDPIPEAITDFEDYQRLFDGVQDESAIGEASTSYLYRPEAPGRIHELIPDAKLIAILRNPADRAFSAYMHVVRDQRETARNFADALNKEPERKAKNWDPIWHYTSVGYYYEQLSCYYQRFDRAQIKVFLYERLIEDQQAMLEEIYQFLAVDPSFTPDSTVKFNVSGEQKSKLIHKLSVTLFSKPNPMRWISRRLIPETWRWKVTNWIRERNLNKERLPQAIREQLIELYRDDILKLQDLIGKDLSHWLE